MRCCRAVGERLEVEIHSKNRAALLGIDGITVCTTFGVVEIVAEMSESDERIAQIPDPIVECPDALSGTIVAAFLVIISTQP